MYFVFNFSSVSSIAPLTLQGNLAGATSSGAAGHADAAAAVLTCR